MGSSTQLEARRVEAMADGNDLIWDVEIDYKKNQLTRLIFLFSKQLGKFRVRRFYSRFIEASDAIIASELL